MPRVQVYAALRSGRLARSLAPLIAAVAVGCCASACSGGTTATASSSPSSPAGAGSSAPAVASQPASTAAVASASGTPAAQDQGTAAAGHSTPGAALADWMHQVAAGNRSAACHDMREPGYSAEKGQSLCMSSAAAASFNGMHTNFVTDGIKPSTPISVTGAQVNGTQATISGNQVHLSGTTLDSLMVAHSTGVKPGQFDMSFKLSKVDGAWYVGDVNMNMGN